MLGRSRMRRGVSLEVIVEEDDNAEVSFDPTPLMEEEDDEEDDEDSENGTGGSTPSSPREEGSRDRDTEGCKSSSAEDRRKKRERRRTIGGLSRFRSVSCEALTLLDTSDMDSCCSEWDDEDDLATSGGSSNYVTLNRPISRRRIIQNIHSQCDSEDSGIEYHSNEDDHVLEDQSSNEDHVDKEEEEEDAKAHEADDNEEYTNPSDSLEDDREDEDECATITMESEDEEDETNDISTGTEQDVGVDAEFDAESESERTEKAGKYKTNDPRARSTSKYPYSPNEALENENIIIVETTPSAPVKKKQQSYLEAAEEEMRLKREAYTIRNKEVRLAELPRPHTVKSVKQLFENLNTPVQHFHAWRDLGRFRDIKSNPSSKILRFDRNDGNDSPISRSQLMSFTLPRLPSQGGYLQQTSEGIQQKTTDQPPRSLTTSTQTSRDLETNNRAAKKAPKNYPDTPMSRILTQSIGQKGVKGENRQQTKSGSKSEESRQQQVVTQNGEKRVALRKPIVKGFNVKRALLENPRNFLPHDHPLNGQQGKQNSQRDTRQKFGNLQKRRHHHHSDVTDRSDTESLASDISDDSGVSNDSIASTSSSSAPSSYRSLDNYASDPSFKWIDPAVMAKIRSVGTTVIFFGPRQRPHQGGTLPRNAGSISSGLQVNKGLQNNRGSQSNARSSHTSTVRHSNRHQERNNFPVPAPRIVGVVRKQSGGANSPNSTPSDSIHSTPGHTTTPIDTHSDDSRTSSPISRYEEEAPARKPVKWRKESDTVVYNFTRPQPPAVYF